MVVVNPDEMQLTLPCRPRAVTPVEDVISRRSGKTGMAGIAQAVAAWSSGLDAVRADAARSLTALLGRTRRALARWRKAWQRRAARWFARAEAARLRAAKSATV